MVVDVPYESLEHTLKSLKLQVIDSLPVAHYYIPSTIQTPKELFYFLKPQLTFKSDPRGVEYIQTMQTLLSKNNGFGDCDCFTVTALTSMWYLHFEPMYVDLAGNTTIVPSHIYTSVWDATRGKICPFDLTNPIYNYERPYKFKQRLPFMI